MTLAAIVSGISLVLVFYAYSSLLRRRSPKKSGLNEDSTSVQHTNPNPTWVDQTVSRQLELEYYKFMGFDDSDVRRRVLNMGMDMSDDQDGDLSDWLSAGFSAAGSDLPAVTPKPANTPTKDPVHNHLN